jgi:hypothetical protein
MGHLRQYNQRKNKRINTLKHYSLTPHNHPHNTPASSTVSGLSLTGSSTNPTIGSGLSLGSFGNAAILGAPSQSTNITTPASSTVNVDFSDVLEKYKQSMPMQQTSWLGMASAAAPALATGIISGINYAKAKKDAKNQQNLVDNLMSQYMSKPIENPYSNLPVATQAAEMKAREVDLTLANTLDNMRAAGYSSGGATALANAAAKAKQGIAADIEKQEVTNAQLEAKGRQIVQSAEFARLDQQMDYEQSKADLYRAQETGSLQSLMAAGSTLGSLGYQAQTRTVTQADIDEGRKFMYK